MRAKSTTVTTSDGTSMRLINIGVPITHPFADTQSQAGNSGLYNLRIGPIKLPVAPTFMIRL